MILNRSVPANVVLPHICYEDVAAAIRWLTETLGFEEHYRYGDPQAPQGAQIHFGDCWIMLTSARPGRSTPKKLGAYTQMLTVFVEDVDALYERVRATGATFAEELNEPVYGERQFVVQDPEGHSWMIATHVKDVAPEEWGAQVAKG
jgi:uncharacterized glyoxalase superfamily protein PhnB